MVAAGFSTFALMNCVQPLMPIFSRDFGISASEASLSLSFTIGALAVLMPVTGALSEIVGRKPVMLSSLVLSALLMIASAFARGWYPFLLYRALQGAAFSGLPAVAMAYMGEEVDPRQTGYAVGLYIGGAAIGGMSGRVIAGVIADIGGWRAAMLAIGLIGLVTALLFAWLLPASRRFTRQPIQFGALFDHYGTHLGDRVQRRLYALGFLLMGCLVVVYNFLGYRLLAPPFSFSQSQVASLFAVYIVGVASSVGAGTLADRFGRPRLLRGSIAVAFFGASLMIVDSVVTIIGGLVVFTVGYFAAHSVVSGWVGRQARVAKAQAASLYLLCYYVGGAALGWFGGVLWGVSGWSGVSAIVLLLLAASFVIAASLHPGFMPQSNAR